MKEQWRQRKQTTLTNTISLRQARELLLVKELKNKRDRKQTTLYMRSGAGSFLKVLLTLSCSVCFPSSCCIHLFHELLKLKTSKCVN